MQDVYVLGYSRLPVKKAYDEPFEKPAAETITKANPLKLQPDAIYASSMTAYELEGQHQIASRLATEAGLSYIEAMDVTAASASGAAALRAGWLAVRSGEVRLAVVTGIERMSAGDANVVLKKALDRSEWKNGETMISRNAALMKLYLKQYGLNHSDFANFGVNAHRNANDNPDALFHKEITTEDFVNARMIHEPLRLMDCSPVCDGAATVMLGNKDALSELKSLDSSNDLLRDGAIRLAAGSSVTDTFRLEDRTDPLDFTAAKLSAQKAYKISGYTPEDIAFVEVHDAFSIMAALCLEAAGFAKKGEGTRLALDGSVFRNGKLPVSTMGGLKGRGHPIGATALYQVTEICDQLLNRAGKCQVKQGPALMQSIAGAAATLFTHIFDRADIG